MSASIKYNGTEVLIQNHCLVRANHRNKKKKPPAAIGYSSLLRLQNSSYSKGNQPKAHNYA